MARPTDPVKLAALRAREAANAANYRARQKAARLGAPVPANAQLKQPARYHPPRTTGIYNRAQATLEQQRERREGLLRQLPDARNPLGNIRPREETRWSIPTRQTAKGKARQVEAFREKVQAERLTEIGKRQRERLRNALTSGFNADRLNENMSPDQRAEFSALAERIASAGTLQSIGILFHHTGGSDEYQSAVERILASPESRDVEEGLDILHRLAATADRAATLYSPSSINPATGRKLGRLTI